MLGFRVCFRDHPTGKCFFLESTALLGVEAITRYLAVSVVILPLGHP